MRRALEGLVRSPEYVLVDARKIPECTLPQRGIVHGDALSLTIAAASIIAKTTRDRMMTEYDALYPGYGFASHKGYPTPEHCRLLKTKGAVPIHRRSFARVRQALGLEPLQLEAFPEFTDEEDAGPGGDQAVG
jgi:ribonuclease HII